MSHPSTPAPQPIHPAVPQGVLWPTAPSGWFALVAAAIGLGSWIVLPLITSLFGTRYPVTDTFVMPIIGTVLILIAAIINVLTLWLGRQRSGANIVATVLTVMATLFFGFFVVGEGLGGA